MSRENRASRPEESRLKIQGNALVESRKMTRQRVIDEAITWLGTPFHHLAQVKGAGVDCAQLLIAVYSAAGLAKAFHPEYYPADWHMHKDEPRFVNTLLDYCDPLPPDEIPQPADIALFRFGRHAAHGAIVEDWPLIIHAWSDVGAVVRSEADIGPLAERLACCYRIRGLK